MSNETLVRTGQEERLLEAQQVQAIGETVFSALAVDAELAMEPATEGNDQASFDFTNSLTRLGDGQTVPDER